MDMEKLQARKKVRKTLSLPPLTAERLERLAEYYDLPAWAVVRMLVAEKFAEITGERPPSPITLRVPVHLEEAEEGGFIVTSSLLEGLHTEGETQEEALANAEDAALAVIELIQEGYKPLPPEWKGIDLSLPFNIEVVIE